MVSTEQNRKVLVQRPVKNINGDRGTPLEPLSIDGCECQISNIAISSILVYALASRNSESSRWQGLYTATEKPIPSRVCLPVDFWRATMCFFMKLRCPRSRTGTSSRYRWATNKLSRTQKVPDRVVDRDRLTG